MSFWENKKKLGDMVPSRAVPPRIVVVIIGEEGAGIEHLHATLMATSHCQPSRTLRHQRRPP
jgi:hypothetical protein